MSDSNSEVKIIEFYLPYKIEIGQMFEVIDDTEAFVCEPVEEPRENWKYNTPTDKERCKVKLEKGEILYVTDYMPEHINNEYTVMYSPKQGVTICTWPILIEHLMRPMKMDDSGTLVVDEEALNGERKNYYPEA